jgi:hypothetical protein
MVLAYKKVAQKVHPIPTFLPEDFRNQWRIPVDPLLSLLPLPTRPPSISKKEPGYNCLIMPYYALLCLIRANKA